MKDDFLNYDNKQLEAALGLIKLAMMKNSAFSMGKKIKKTLFQTIVLENVFNITSLPSAHTQFDLSVLLKIPQRSVQVWFQNARQLKKKKQRDTKAKCIEEFDEVYDVPVARLVKLIEKVKDSRKLC